MKKGAKLRKSKGIPGQLSLGGRLGDAQVGKQRSNSGGCAAREWVCGSRGEREKTSAKGGRAFLCIILSARQPSFNGTSIHLRMRKKATQRGLRSSYLRGGRRYKSLWCHGNLDGQARTEGWL